MPNPQLQWQKILQCGFKTWGGLERKGCASPHTPLNWYICASRRYSQVHHFAEPVMHMSSLAT
jgi:hypothetical protein